MLKIRKIRNKDIRDEINIKISVLGYIRYKQLNCYDHVRRMYEERLPQNILKCFPSGKKKKKKKKGKTSKFANAENNN